MDRSPSLPGPLRLLLCLVVALMTPACKVVFIGDPGAPVTFVSHTVAGLAVPRGMAVADFNGDGKPDLAIADTAANQVSVCLNTGVPGDVPAFGPATSFATGANSAAVAAADFNGDGRQDLAVVNPVPATISVLLNTTAPGPGPVSFSAAVNFGAGATSQAITVTDLNLDGRLDLVVANAGGGAASFFRNITAPGAAAPDFDSRIDIAIAPGCSSVAVLDLQGDGRPDVVAASPNVSFISVLLNTTVPGSALITFSPKTDFAGATGASGMVAVEADLDGRPDIVVVNRQSDTISVFRNTTPLGGAAPSFAARVDVAVPDSPDAIASGDVDGDGRLDIVFGSSAASYVEVLLNRSVPGLAGPDFARFRVAASSSSSLVAADFNLDGMVDVAVDSLAEIRVLRNATTPPPSEANFVQNAHFNLINLRLADFDLDGKPDIVGITGSGAVSGIGTCRNDTAAGSFVTSFTGFPEIPISTSPGCINLVVDDFNVDGKPDVAVVNLNLANVSVFLNTTVPGSGLHAFASRVDFPVGFQPTAAASADLNGDGLPDLAVTNRGAATISILLNTTSPGSTTPSFSAKTDFVSGPNPTGIALGDLNGDGRPDLVATLYFVDTVTVYFNTTPVGGTTPTLSAPTTFPTGAEPDGVAIGDLNGDGRPDLAVANEGAGTASVLINTAAVGAVTPSFSPTNDFATAQTPHMAVIADLTGNGRPELAIGTRGAMNVSILFNTTSPGAPIPAFNRRPDLGSGNHGQELGVGDMNGDGKPDIVTSSTFGHFDVFLRQ